MEGLARKTPYGFEPSGEEGQKIHKGMAIGDLCKVEKIMTRNYENHKRYFAFIQTVFDIQEHFADKDQMRKWVQMRAGYYDEFIAPNGKTVFLSRSIAFDRLEELAFRELFSKSITAVINANMQDGSEFVPNMTENQLMQILEFD